MAAATPIPYADIDEAIADGFSRLATGQYDGKTRAFQLLNKAYKQEQYEEAAGEAVRRQRLAKMEADLAPFEAQQRKRVRDQLAAPDGLLRDDG